MTILVVVLLAALAIVRFPFTVVRLLFVGVCKMSWMIVRALGHALRWNGQQLAAAWRAPPPRRLSQELTEEHRERLG